METTNLAILTYNHVGKAGSHPNGWHEAGKRRAFLLQRMNAKSGELKPEERHDEISLLWEELEKILPSLDWIIIYLGADGSQRAIELATKLPGEKIIFVSCDCGLDVKSQIIRSAGIHARGHLVCECGGHRCLDTLFHSFLGTGELPLD